MENAKAIRNRIKSVGDTQKITNAMQLISTNKLRKARRDLEKTRPYFEALKGEIGWIFQHTPDVSSRYFGDFNKKTESEKTQGYLVITADKGLAGAYNHNVLKLAMAQLQDNKSAKLYVVGEFGRQFFRQKKIPVEKSFLYTAQNPSMHRAREIRTTLLEQFNSGALDEIHVIYTDMKNSLTTKAEITRLLPFERERFTPSGKEGHPATEHYEYFPSVKQVLENVMPSYVSGYIYSVLVYSFCSEQNARMTAMDSASRNADDMLRALSVRYNSVRQAAITQEITEVAAGAKAQKHKKEAPAL